MEAGGSPAGPSRIAIITNTSGPSLNYSETFIRAHIERLPCEKMVLTGNPGNRTIDDCRDRRVKDSFVRRGAQAIKYFLGNSPAIDGSALVRFLQEQEIDLVLAEYGTTAVSVMDACVKSNVPLVAHFHGYDAYRQDVIRRYGSGYKSLFRQASALVAVSTDMQRRLIEMGARPEGTFYNPCGVSVFEDWRASPGKSDPRFLMVGRLVEKKGPLLSIRAFHKMNISDAILDIIGDGPLMGDCLDLIKRLGITHRVTLHGQLGHDEVFGFMRNARCFIQHSIRAKDGDSEGTPVAVLEAMAAGLPVVATAHCGIADAITNKSLGILVQEGDIEAMAIAMRESAANPNFAQKIGDSARKEIMAKWTLEHRISGLWNILTTARSQGTCRHDN